MLLLLVQLAFADSFLTSVALPLPAGVASPSAPGACEAEVARLATSTDAFEHAMVLGACHGYDANPALVAVVKHASGPLHQLDVGYTLMYAATYGGHTGRAAEASIRAAMIESPADPRVLLVGALVLAQREMFVKDRDWQARTPRTEEIVGIVRKAALLNLLAPSPHFDEGLHAAVDYLVMYGAFADLANLAGSGGSAAPAAPDLAPPVDGQRPPD